jgi:hypothetical protein
VPDIPMPAAPYWEGPIADPAVLNAQPQGTVAIDDVNRLRQRRYTDSAMEGGWTSAGLSPLSSSDLVQDGTRPVFLLRQCTCDFPDAGHTLLCPLRLPIAAAAHEERMLAYEHSTAHWAQVIEGLGHMTPEDLVAWVAGWRASSARDRAVLQTRAILAAPATEGPTS